MAAAGKPNIPFRFPPLELLNSIPSPEELKKEALTMTIERAIKISSIHPETPFPPSPLISERIARPNLPDHVLYNDIYQKYVDFILDKNYKTLISLEDSINRYLDYIIDNYEKKNPPIKFYDQYRLSEVISLSTYVKQTLKIRSGGYKHNTSLWFHHCY